MSPRILLWHLAPDTSVRPALKAAYPEAVVLDSAEPNVMQLTGPFDAAIVAASTNAEFARVRRLRQLHPATCIIVTGARDWSARAYMAGANEYVVHYDTDRMLYVLAEALGPASAPVETRPIAGQSA